MGDYLKRNHPGYLFTAPEKTINDHTLIKTVAGEYFRLFSFTENSHSVDVVETPEQAYKAAALFGGFTKRLAGLATEQLQITLPHFHDLSLRHNQFTDAVKQGNPDRIKESAVLIKAATENAGIVTTYKNLVAKSILKTRPTHHDTKISNVLFDDKGNGLCVIDLDTVMPGYFISDTGDMLRTMLSPVSEEETDMTKLEIRDEFYKAIYAGYLDEMRGELGEEEKKQFFYSGMYMLYMQGLRFLTDYLNNDIYYGASYPGHNFYRAKNQFTMLRLLQEKQTHLQRI